MSSLILNIEAPIPWVRGCIIQLIGPLYKPTPEKILNALTYGDKCKGTPK